jgi:3-keto-L-gulonate-6-phosphate decarboxylase
MGAVVARWSGLEARALREAKRMSVREFAAHLGINVGAVSTWEKRGARAQLRYETQQLLDTDLAKLDEDGLRRFVLILGGIEVSSPPPDHNDPAVGSTEAWSVPHVGGADRQGLGGRSAQRTGNLVAAMRAGRGALATVAPAGVVERLRRFVESTARVYVVKGPPGCGKTTMVGHFAAELAGEVDSQVHAVDSWPLGQLDLPLQVLRYASVPGGADPLLTLEQQAAGLDRDLLVVIDGISSREQLHEVGRQLDMILRQVTQARLRFVLVMRTPPDLDLTAHPVLAASVHEPDPRDGGVSFRLAPWQPEQAREVWDAAREPGQPAFADLPPSLQQLATLPLYLTLLHAAGRTATDRPATAFRLVDHCVRSILRRAGVDAAAATEALSDLALRNSDTLLPPSLSARPSQATRGNESSPPDDLPPLVVTSPAGLRFTHDVIREYFAAVRVADLLIRQGRSVASVSALNDLAEQATSSASARGIFEFVVCRLDDRDPHLAAAIALSPTVSVDATLPLMLRAATPSMGFATAQVVQSSATRCSQPHALELARSLLATPLVAAALGETYSEWVVTVLRTFGPSVWRDMLSHLEQNLDADMAARLLATADLERGEEATFFARHALLFHGIPLDGWLESLASHADWRVRAALADGLLAEPNRHHRLTVPVVRRLVDDDDYKVRAAVARAIARAPLPAWAEQLDSLIVDVNWHVRASLLRGLLSVGTEPRSDEAATAVADRLVADDENWRHAPAEAARLRHRLLLLSGVGTADDTVPRARALFGLLREIRTAWTTVPEPTLERLVAEGRRSTRWLVHREVDAIETVAGSQGGAADARTGMARREDFRRLRGRHAVQIALDLHDLDHALHVAEALAAAGVDFVEVGDPLIKQAGVRAVEQVKRVVGATRVVAEMMSADWGRDQVEQAAEAGADVVLLIGPATAASVSAAVEAGRRLGTPILLDVPTLHASQQWVREMERAGVDGFTVTSNIDIGVGVGHPLARARAVRSWSRLPVAVSGGFSVTDLPVLTSEDWDILIVGRSITEAIRPKSAADQLLKIVHTQRERQDYADHRP